MKCLNKYRSALSFSGLCLVLLALACFLVPAKAFAAESSTGATPSAKVHITADRMVSNTKDRYAEFSGNVNAVQENTKIQADSLRIYYKEGADLTSEAQNQEDLIQRIVATGHVRIDVSDKTAYGDKVIYTSKNGLLVLTGKKARIESEGNYINGEEIVLNRATGQISVTGGSSDRVEAVFESTDDTEKNTENTAAPEKKTAP